MTLIVSLFTLSLFTTSALALAPRQYVSSITSAPIPAPSACMNKSHQFVATKDNGSVDRYYCPGVVVGTEGSDVSNAYCCIGSVFTTGLASTHWFYNYTMASIPSTVYTPTICVQPIALTAESYNDLASSAVAAITTSASIPTAAAAGGSTITPVTETATATRTSTLFETSIATETATGTSITTQPSTPTETSTALDTAAATYTGPASTGAAGRTSHITLVGASMVAGSMLIAAGFC